MIEKESQNIELYLKNILRQKTKRKMTFSSVNLKNVTNVFNIFLINLCRRKKILFQIKEEKQCQVIKTVSKTR